jgi:hypothetical protein
MKHPALKAEDGASLYCEIQRIEGVGFRASCFARNKSETQVEEHEFHMCASHEEGKVWIASYAKRRRFDTYWLKTKV